LLRRPVSETTELTIVVVSAEELPRPCDACVYLSIGDNDRATTRRPAAAAPLWNERFVFYVGDDETLSAKVFDNEDFVAEAIVPVTELLYVAEATPPPPPPPSHMRGGGCFPPPFKIP